MVQSFELRLLLLEDGSIICQNLHSKQSHTLGDELAPVARQLIEDAYPVVVAGKKGANGIKPPARSAELAKLADSLNDRTLKYRMDPVVVKFLGEVALFKEGISVRDISKVLDMNQNTASGLMSRLHQNRYVREITKSRYMVVPEGHLFLEEQAPA